MGSGPCPHQTSSGKNPYVPLPQYHTESQTVHFRFWNPLLPPVWWHTHISLSGAAGTRRYKPALHRTRSVSGSCCFLLLVFRIFYPVILPDHAVHHHQVIVNLQALKHPHRGLTDRPVGGLGNKAVLLPIQDAPEDNGEHPLHAYLLIQKLSNGFRLHIPGIILVLMHHKIYDPVLRHGDYKLDQAPEPVPQVIIKAENPVSLPCIAVAPHELVGNQITGIVNHNGLLLASLQCCHNFCIIIRLYGRDTAFKRKRLFQHINQGKILSHAVSHAGALPWPAPADNQYWHCHNISPFHPPWPNRAGCPPPAPLLLPRDFWRSSESSPPQKNPFLPIWETGLPCSSPRDLRYTPSR